MTTAILAATIIVALIVGILGGFAYARLTDRPREPQTDTEHADLIHEKAWEINIVMHNARAAGLNPALAIGPIDDELPPGSRPIRATVQRDGKTVIRSSPEFVATITDRSHIGERRFSRFFDDHEVEVVRYVDDDNWWFKIIGQEQKGVAKAKTPLSQMPRTREEAYSGRR